MLFLVGKINDLMSTLHGRHRVERGGHEQRLTRPYTKQEHPQKNAETYHPDPGDCFASQFELIFFDLLSLSCGHKPHSLHLFRCRQTDKLKSVGQDYPQGIDQGKASPTERDIL